MQKKWMEGAWAAILCLEVRLQKENGGRRGGRSVDALDKAATATAEASTAGKNGM